MYRRLRALATSVKRALRKQQEPPFGGWKLIGTRLEPPCNMNVSQAIRQAIALASGLSTPYIRPELIFEFNSVLIQVAPDSDWVLIYRDYQRAWHGHIEGPVGPYPVYHLPLEEEDAYQALLRYEH